MCAQAHRFVPLVTLLLSLSALCFAGVANSAGAIHQPGLFCRATASLRRCLEQFI